MDGRQFLASSDAAQIATLLRLRRELAHPVPRTLSDLAARLDRPQLTAAGLRHLNQFQCTLAEAVAAFGPTTPEWLATVTGVAADQAELSEALNDLCARGVIGRRDGGKIVGVGGLANLFPTPLRLGRKLSNLAKDRNAQQVKNAAKLLTGTAHTTKPAAVDALRAALADDKAVESLLSTAPPFARDLLEYAKAEPAVGVPTNVARSPEVAWCADRLLVAPRVNWQGTVLEFPRELCVALRGPAIAPVSPTCPPAASHLVPRCDEIAADAARHALSHLHALLDELDTTPSQALRSGGFGQRDIKRVTKSISVAERDVARLVEIAGAAGLLGAVLVPKEVPKGKRAQRSYYAAAPDYQWIPAEYCDEWAELSSAEQWAVLVSSWLASTRYPSLAGERDENGKPIPALEPHQGGDVAAELRAAVLRVLFDAPIGERVKLADVEAAVEWCAPMLLRSAPAEAHRIVGWTLTEAEMLGLTGGGALGGAGRLLLSSDAAAATDAAAGWFDGMAASLTLQADLTAVAVGTLPPSVLRRLRGMADLESRGAASIWRLSETSLSRALDSGETCEEILAFLAEHAAKGVPQPVTYLVEDTARRRDRVRVVGEVGCVVVLQDAAVAAEVARTKRLAKLQLTALAPTVLASPKPTAAVTEALRAAGFAPRADGNTATVAGTAVTPSRARARVARPTASVASDATVDFDALAKQLLTATPTSSAQRWPEDSPCRDDGWIEDDADEFAYGDDDVVDLREAIARRASVAVLDVDGRILKGQPVLLSGGTLALRDPTGRVHTISLAKIDAWEIG